jgi:hypothetical protein
MQMPLAAPCGRKGANRPRFRGKHVFKPRSWWPGTNSGQGIGRPFVAPPGLAPDRLKMLRDAFDTTMKDPDFIADATKQQLVLMPESGADLAALIDKIYATPKPIVEKVAKLVN